ncbi:MAG: cysteine desulfurase family protein [Planctomycetota bacterium]|nr:cysteine desulfurase family protein [Planctomycetota bacterium]
MIYLDHNATTPPHPEVVELTQRLWRDAFANPGSRHTFGRRARQVLESARESFAALLGAFPDEVVFTSGGTEANNMAVLGFTRGSPGHIGLTAGEHPAVLETCRWLETQGFSLVDLPVDSDGLLEPAGYAVGGEFPWSDCRLVSVILAHNETGVIQNLSPLAEICASRRIPFHVDGLQAVGKIPVNFHELGASTLAVGAHKFQGLRGAGALLVRRGWNLAPTAFGGHQEAERRPGTEAVPLVAGMVRALELFHADREARMDRQRRLRDRLEEGLRDRCPPVVLNGARTERLPNTLNLAFPGVDGEALLVALDLAGVACSLGSACSSGASEPAPVLISMKKPRNVLLSSVRFSLGADTTTEEIDAAIRVISEIVVRLRRMSGEPEQLAVTSSA